MINLQDDIELDLVETSDIMLKETTLNFSASNADEAPIIRFVNKIILNAIHSNTSDIHFEPYENEYRIRYRQDGILKEIAKPSANLASRLTSRLKVMANLDISEKRLPQDGRFKMNLSLKQSISFRINSCPTLFGEKIVLRILDSTAVSIGVEKLGFEMREKLLFEQALSKPQGMILVTGPTGSGKTVTLYTALDILNKTECNISTVEDPIEIYLSGINQVNVNDKTGLTFADALRAFLRQDPDIIMVGEIRDTETGEIAINAAQTGHLVLSTLHTKSAADTLARLSNMGISPFNIASSVTLIVAQRLIRCLCSACKEPLQLSKEVLLKEGLSEKELSNLTLYKAVGCNNCYQGYRGQTGIYEVMPITAAIEELILANAKSSEIVAQALKEGMTNLRQAGLEKIKNGISTFEEINRATLI